MQAITRNDPDLQTAWASNLEHGVTFEIGNLATFKDSKNKTRKGKDHPYAVLCDWLAACCMAKLNPAQLDRNIGYTKRELKAFTSIIDTATSKKAMKIYDLDDPEIQDAIKAQKRNND